MAQPSGGQGKRDDPRWRPNFRMPKQAHSCNSSPMRRGIFGQLAGLHIAHARDSKGEEKEKVGSLWACC